MGIHFLTFLAEYYRFRCSSKSIGNLVRGLLGRPCSTTLRRDLQCNVRTILHSQFSARNNENADLGIFITLAEATSGMRVQAAREGFMTVGNTDIPRIQFWQITDHYFKTRVPDVILPQQWMVDDRKRAEIYHGGEQIRLIH